VTPKQIAIQRCTERTKDLVRQHYVQAKQELLWVELCKVSIVFCSVLKKAGASKLGVVGFV
jgi:hypothetical protein